MADDLSTMKAAIRDPVILPPCIQRRLQVANIMQPGMSEKKVELPPGVTLHTGVNTWKLSANLIPLALGFSKYQSDPVEVNVYYSDLTSKYMTVNASELRDLSNDPTVHNILGMSTTKF